MFISRSDAPTCKECGSIMAPKGDCYACVNCGAKCECQSPPPPAWVPKHKHDVQPIPKVVVREVVAPPACEIVTEVWHGRPSSDVLVREKDGVTIRWAHLITTTPGYQGVIDLNAKSKKTAKRRPRKKGKR